MSTPYPERRKEPRFPGSGRVEVTFENPERETVLAELKDRSNNGIRIAHQSENLVPGLEVQLRHAGSDMRARVVWTHYLEGQRVSGCLLL